MPRKRHPSRLQKLATARQRALEIKQQPEVLPTQETLPALDEEYTFSRTEQKFAHFGQETNETHNPDVTRTIVDLQQIDLLVKQVCCPECCNKGTLRLHQDTRMGLVVPLSLFCDACNTSVTETIPSSTQTDKKYTVNKSAVFASLQVGLGPCRFNNFCQHMDMPGLHHSSFNKHAKDIYDERDTIADSVSTTALEIINEAYKNNERDEDGCMQIAVSFDGSWLTRGHKSMIGIGCVVEVLTGLVLDSHVMSQHCQICATTGENKRKESPEAYALWLESHNKSGKCSKNFTGTSGMMEVEAAVVLWSRSVEKFHLKYTTFVGDGDSKAYNKVCEVQPYGPDTQIVKEECVNHVSKRMSTALRNLVSDSSKKGITLGGRGQGRLTGNAIGKLTKYFDRAIRGNPTATEMKRAIMASLYHCYSTDENPQHQYCPPGPDSWCFYKRALANHTYPFAHHDRIHTPLDMDLLHPHLSPIYERLTSDNLLSRCERKATQNANESFHSSVWAKCSKSQFHSRQRMEVAVTSAAAEYNFGPSSVNELRGLLQNQAGEHSARLAEVRAKKRLDKSLEKNQQPEKRRRKIRKEAQDKAQREEEEAEGAAYAPGMF
ncbi:hypothetical protein PoB_005399200 [Plakobranchus ocellatus]|uniref:Mutator-like transposase domain-containing protein n=1 Tax=Plakobranchus ocellatus TaxID=259542 RepID=A0AAV4C7Z1_9GAST|nr:hypothetical protein PoB_005399200 [Plakobranchus ocellatus]